MGTVALVVTESGGQWPGQVGEHENVVIVGHDEDDLVQRTRRRLDSLQRQGQRVRVAVLACCDATDFASVTRRAVVAHDLLSAVVVVRFGRLVLTSPLHASIQLRRELLSLAGALSDKLHGTSAAVCVRCGGTEDARQEVRDLDPGLVLERAGRTPLKWPERQASR